MTISLYQIVVPALSFLLVFYAWSLFMKKKKTLWEALLWTLFWGAIAVIALYPDLLSFLSFILGFKNRENAVIVISIGILFFLVFYLIIRIEELEQRQTRIVRSMALREAGIKCEKAGMEEKASG